MLNDYQLTFIALVLVGTGVFIYGIVDVNLQLGYNLAYFSGQSKVEFLI